MIFDVHHFSYLDWDAMGRERKKSPEEAWSQREKEES